MVEPKEEKLCSDKKFDIRMKLRRDSELPRTTLLRTVRLDPKRATPKIDTAEPSLTKV